MPQLIRCPSQVTASICPQTVVVHFALEEIRSEIPHDVWFPDDHVCCGVPQGTVNGRWFWSKLKLTDSVECSLGRAQTWWWPGMTVCLEMQREQVFSVGGEASNSHPLSLNPSFIFWVGRALKKSWGFYHTLMMLSFPSRLIIELQTSKKNVYSLSIYISGLTSRVLFD